MKNRFSWVILFTLGLYSLQACEDTCGCGPTSFPVSYRIAGRWEWVKTVTPNRTITPQTAGYTEQMNFVSKDGANQVIFYRNDSLQLHLTETSNRHGVIQEDQKQKTVLIEYGSAGQLKFRLQDKPQNTDGGVIVSSLMKPYSSKADTIQRHFERR